MNYGESVHVAIAVGKIINKQWVLSGARAVQEHRKVKKKCKKICANHPNQMSTAEHIPSIQEASDSLKEAEFILKELE